MQLSEKVCIKKGCICKVKKKLNLDSATLQPYSFRYIVVYVVPHWKYMISDCYKQGNER